VIGEANFSDHGANRLGASALMQGLADGYFILPYTIGDYLAPLMGKKVGTDRQEFAAARKDVEDRIAALLGASGKRSAESFWRELGKIMWGKVGMAREKAGLIEARQEVRSLRDAFWKDVKILGGNEETNQVLEKAIRVADYFELAELLCVDALHREESAGGHFRVEHQTPDGEAKRNDHDFTYVAAWEWKGLGAEPVLHKEKLGFETVKLSTRSYK
jgi:succinate dehydrogenase / fumarate reductase flavoprotein subunit